MLSCFFSSFDWFAQVTVYFFVYGELQGARRSFLISNLLVAAANTNMQHFWGVEIHVVENFSVVLCWAKHHDKLVLVGGVLQG